MSGRIPELLLNPPVYIVWTISHCEGEWVGIVTDLDENNVVGVTLEWHDADLDELMGSMVTGIRATIQHREVCDRVTREMWTGFVGGSHD